jgi:uncharacterized RDD family membrane protein YckC
VIVSENHYDVLGVDPAASRDELREAYRARVDELTAAREKKGVSERQLQDNREDVAKVRTAWNVLSDPFQRQRYDAQVSDSTATGDVEIVDDVDGDAPGAEVQLTGWRKFMAPPPPKSSGGSAGRGAQGAAGARPTRVPTVVLPPGMKIAEPKARGMALLFDLAVVLIILYAVQFVVPGMIQSDYKDKVDQIEQYDNAAAAQGDIDDAKKAVNEADQAIANAQDRDNSNDLESAQSDRRDAQNDLQDARKDFDDAAEELRADGIADVPHNVKQLENRSDTLADDIRGTQYLTALVTLVLALLYLVPITAKTGSTLGMRGRKIKVVRVDGSPIGWYPAFARFVIPILIALAIPTLGPIIGLGLVLWGYRDPNGQGVHDKLARTLVVEA